MSGLRKIGSIIEGWRPPAASPGEDGTALAAIAWPEVVGTDVARRTRAGKLRDGILTVYTAASTWSHQLTFLAPSILAELRARIPGVRVDRLRFVVATGPVRASMDKTAARRVHREKPSEQKALRSDALDEAPEAVEDIIARLRRRQAALNRRRAEDGWSRCASCGVWHDPRSDAGDVCAACIAQRRREADLRIERVLAHAPWLHQTDVLAHVPGSDAEAFERVRRHLLARWEEQLFVAGRRLRRGTLEAADRVVGWSYAMLRTGKQQQALGRAVIADALGPEWAQALLPATEREATTTAVKKQTKTNARVKMRGDIT